ncbi:SDR family oxidoreductase [Alkalihalobacillus oceani]|uniref:SDR family oxidoreductase n=1 Tax=Halalkalibacter oceani TaxID=1653776 RepID=A0A9X2DPU9_9BACI|nr:SDR family oxidoreductase [Halalkalibacter oceani]MCM3714879.1 SDR family oxidoreductase [Halalkalibacter oceani]
MKTKRETIWITGASSGLGRELALAAARRGAHVVLLARNEKRLNEVKAEVEALGGSADAFPLDVSDLSTTETRIPHIMKEVGGIDVLINNAGFGKFAELTDTPVETIEEMFAVNVTGLMTFTKAVLPFMLEANRGHIINIASQAGKLATAKASVYAATKHAVLGFTNAMRLELSETNIKVSAVNPGPIKTPFFTRADEHGSYLAKIDKWILKPEEVAKATLQLLDKPKRERNLPGWMNWGAVAYQLMPGFIEKIAGKQFRQK